MTMLGRSLGFYLIYWGEMEKLVGEDENENKAIDNLKNVGYESYNIKEIGHLIYRVFKHAQTDANNLLNECGRRLKMHFIKFKKYKVEVTSNENYIKEYWSIKMELRKRGKTGPRRKVRAEISIHPVGGKPNIISSIRIDEEDRKYKEIQNIVNTISINNKLKRIDQITQRLYSSGRWPAIYKGIFLSKVSIPIEQMRDFDLNVDRLIEKAILPFKKIKSIDLDKLF